MAKEQRNVIIHLHSLRHFVAEMLAQGVGVRDVAEVLGRALVE